MPILSNFWKLIALSTFLFVGSFSFAENGIFNETCPCGPDCGCNMGANCDCLSKGSHWWDKPLFCTVDCCYPTWAEFLPGSPQLMTPFLADPRQVNYSAGWRFNDRCLVKNVIPVSYGGSIPLIRFNNIWPWCGALQLELEGCLWAVFDPLHDSSPLMNADYYIGFPLIYCIDNWQFRLRGYHISCHIGDEFLLNHRNFRRLNPSAEYLDFFISHQMTKEIRVYAGVGAVLASDESYPCKTFYAEAGGEVHMYDFGFVNSCGKICGNPFFAIYLRHRGENKRHVDLTYALGYEFGKTYGREPLLRAFLEYHDGYSVEGQYSRFPTRYFAFKVTYGY